MSRLPYKQRKKLQARVIPKTIPSYILEIAHHYMETGAFQHRQTEGAEREKPVQAFFKNHIPGKFDVVKGEVVDLFEKHSPQLDVMIFNSHNNCAFVSGESCLLPAEALLSSIEVKSTLNKQEIATCLKAAANLRQLKPFGKELSAVRTEGKSAKDELCRYFNAIFAYTSDLSEENWLTNEYSRIISVAEEIGISPNVIDRVYVVNRGLINFYPDCHMGITETQNSGRALIRLYMDVLSFITREDARRKLVPYIEYGGRSKKEKIMLSVLQKSNNTI